METSVFRKSLRITRKAGGRAKELEGVAVSALQEQSCMFPLPSFQQTVLLSGFSVSSLQPLMPQSFTTAEPVCILTTARKRAFSSSTPLTRYKAESGLLPPSMMFYMDLFIHLARTFGRQ